MMRKLFAATAIVVGLTGCSTTKANHYWQLKDNQTRACAEIAHVPERPTACSTLAPKLPMVERYIPVATSIRNCEHAADQELEVALRSYEFAQALGALSYEDHQQLSFLFLLLRSEVNEKRANCLNIESVDGQVEAEEWTIYNQALNEYNIEARQCLEWEEQIAALEAPRAICNDDEIILDSKNAASNTMIFITSPEISAGDKIIISPIVLPFTALADIL